MAPGEDTEGNPHGHRLEDVETPLVLEEVAVDAEGEFDQTEDGTDLLASVRRMRGRTGRRT
jgi:hypothetical protein